MREPFDRFLIVGAYYLVAARHNSGQWSIGYRKLSQCARLGYKPGLSVFERGSDERKAAAALLWKRRQEIRDRW